MEFHSRFLLTSNKSGNASAPHYVCNGAGVKLAFLPTMEVGFNAYVNCFHILQERGFKP